ncbi:tRNA pseudouridine(38-40) synthase TruA [Acetobacter sp. AN02]|uniref:tRNA pseudouridine(38-40) synthase TruA n=1 Tax=Acetobacter sp. AN02 TaxID=2894186 RepID=UPI00243453D2|nr:tRNA pseudouridine(38-40) synthase TruA [Acetobacter sp. AN02]MDG6095135.1 tRNA pseudouridine(38-40) synthase TruA [Acetobacter sp. AN02]
MQRWAVLLEYDGTDFVGWQRQENGVSVQSVLEEAARRLSGGSEVPSVTAGRTDAGVHATGQVAHLDFPAGLPLTARAVRDGLSFHLKPYPVVVLAAAPVSAEWSARFSATGRAYRYRILNRPSRPALEQNRIWHVKFPLDAEAMHAAAQTILGRHDFTSFRAAACQAKSPLRTLDRLDVRREGEVISVIAEARSFLHHQVRNLVGSLQLVGCGRWPVSGMRTALDARDRCRAGPTAPPDGLILTGVVYPEPVF